MIVLKKNVKILAKLKAKGYKQKTLKEKYHLCEYNLQRLRDGKMVSLKALDTLCELLECQPGDLIEYIKK